MNANSAGGGGAFKKKTENKERKKSPSASLLCVTPIGVEGQKKNALQSKAHVSS